MIPLPRSSKVVASPVKASLTKQRPVREIAITTKEWVIQAFENC